MTITIDLGTTPAIIIACECYLEDAKKKKRKVDETIILTVSEIITNKELQEYWIRKGLGLKKNEKGKRRGK